MIRRLSSVSQARVCFQVANCRPSFAYFSEPQGERNGRARTGNSSLGDCPPCSSLTCGDFHDEEMDSEIFINYWVAEMVVLS